MKTFAPLLLFALFILACTDPQLEMEYKEKLSLIQAELDSLRALSAEKNNEPKAQLSTFLTFQNNDAEEAMNFYVSLFENSKITDIRRHTDEGPAKAGSILMATFELNGSQFACSDSYIKHEWNFTPGVSNWVDCKSVKELEHLFAKLSENGKVMMPIGSYGWSEQFAFVEDRFGVSWQLNYN